MAKEIREVLMDEIDSLLSGKSDNKRANAVAKLSAQVIYKDRLKMEEKVLVEKVRRWNKGGDL